VSIHRQRWTPAQRQRRKWMILELSEQRFQANLNRCNLPSKMLRADTNRKHK